MEAMKPCKACCPNMSPVVYAGSSGESKFSFMK